MEQDIQKRIKSGESFIIANDGQYLGKLTLNEFDPESIYNEFGKHGSEFSATSIFNEFGKYGGEFSSLSPFNEFTSTPPIIFLSGKEYGYLSSNEFLGGVTINPNTLLKFLEENNLNY